MNKPLKHVSLMGVRLVSKSNSEVLDWLSTRIFKRIATSVFTPNPEIVVQAQRDSAYKKLLNSSDLNVVDGVGLIHACKFLGKGSLHRYPGRELFIDLLSIADKEGYKVYLLGASENTNKSAVEKIKLECKSIKVKGNSAGKVDADGNLSIDIAKEIKSFDPDIVFVALGAPKQEKWISKNSKKEKRLYMAVGGTLDYFIEKAMVPPILISGLGLEWLWRVVFEPWRIKRILVATVVFTLYVIKLRLGIDSKET